MSEVLLVQLQLLHTIGTAPGGSDVVDFTTAGIINQLVLSNLQLLSGIDYYATVKGLFICSVIIIIGLFNVLAYNFVGSMAQATSMAVTVDTSPPIISEVWIGKQLSHSVTSRYNNVVSWNPVLDPESGLSSMEWAVGKVMRHHVSIVILICYRLSTGLE